MEVGVAALVSVAAEPSAVLAADMNPSSVDVGDEASVAGRAVGPVMKLLKPGTPKMVASDPSS